MTIIDRTQAGLALALANFEAEYGTVLGCALSVYAEEMRKTAAECAGADTEQPPAWWLIRAADGLLVQLNRLRRRLRRQHTINLTPTPGGFRGMARLFTESAVKADRAAAAYEALAELAAELDNDEY